MKKIKKLFLLSLLATTSIAITNKAHAYREIPCGIYEDTLRIELIKEHDVTI